MSAELRNEWICSGCGVRVYNVGGSPFPPPTGWHHETETCLACTKKDEPPEQRAHRMLLNDETINKISRACQGVNKVEITAIRAKLIEAGKLSPDSNEAKPPRKGGRSTQSRKAHKRSRIEAALRADPDRSNKTLAKELEVGASTVRRTRKALDLDPPSLDWRGRPIK